MLCRVVEGQRIWRAETGDAGGGRRSRESSNDALRVYDALIAELGAARSQDHARANIVTKRYGAEKMCAIANCSTLNDSPKIASVASRGSRPDWPLRRR